MSYVEFHPYYSGLKSIWVKSAQRNKPKIENPCLFNSYQSIYCVAVNFRGKPLTEFGPKVHFHRPPQPVYQS